MFRNFFSRRTFFRATTAAAGTAAVNQFLTENATAKATELTPGTTILFQGDSITDCHRNRKQNGPNVARGFGLGYPLLIASKLLADNPTANLKAYNRGISGHKVPDLANRWQKDCIDLKPDVLSILIGVNDIWHKLGGNYDGTVADYENGFTDLLQSTREALPETRIIVCEPFALRCGAVNDKWYPEMDERRAACKRVATKMDCSFVPFQTIFDEATTDETPASYWAGDGVHPSMAGHALMAKAWLDAFDS